MEAREPLAGPLMKLRRSKCLLLRKYNNHSEHLHFGPAKWEDEEVTFFVSQMQITCSFSLFLASRCLFVYLRALGNGPVAHAAGRPASEECRKMLDRCAGCAAGPPVERREGERARREHARN